MNIWGLPKLQHHLMCLKSLSSHLQTIFLVCLTDSSNSSARSSKITPSINLRFMIFLSLSAFLPMIHSSIRCSNSDLEISFMILLQNINQVGNLVLVQVSKKSLAIDCPHIVISFLSLLFHHPRNSGISYNPNFRLSCGLSAYGLLSVSLSPFMCTPSFMTASPPLPESRSCVTVKDSSMN